MARHLPVSTLAGQLDETDTRLWRFISHYVDEARGLEDHTGVEAIGVDGTSRKGRNCITVVAGLVEHDVTDVTPGRDSTTVERFAGDFMDHDGVPGRVRLVTCGMSRGFQKDIREHLPMSGGSSTSSTWPGTPTRPSTRSGRPRGGRTGC